MPGFPVPPEDCTFLGMPIDYVAFKDTGSKTKCSVHFVEVKSGSAFLMGKQKNIKKAIEEGRVHWHEITVDGNTVK
jgi:predicted Holliday junction resolvase-like endonuclease